MSAGRELLLLLIIVLSNIVQAVTGFAGTMLAMPAAMLLMDVSSAKAVLNSVAIATCVIVTAKDYKYINLRELIKINFIMLAGMGAGIAIMGVVPMQALLCFYGGLIIAIAVNRLFIKKTIVLPKPLQPLLIFFAGIVHGLFVSGGSLLVIYAVNALRDKREFRATLAAVWVVLDTLLLFSHIRAGYFTPAIIKTAIIASPLTLLSVWIGNRLVNKIDQGMFLKLTYILLLISGFLIFI